MLYKQLIHRSFLAVLCGQISLTTSANAAEEFVVTGERRDVALRDTPLSITRFDTDTIERVNADHPSELLSRSPGVLIHRGSGQEHLTAIRSPVLTGGAGAGSFLFLENGVPLRSAGFANVNGLFEAQTETAGALEVVRGPSGALYGANAIHGVINVVPREVSDELAGYLDISGDTIERIKGKGWVSQRIGGHGFALGVSVLDDPGFRAESGADQQKLSLRHDYRGERISVDSFISAFNLNQETAGFVQGENAFLDPDLRRTNPNPEAFRDVRSLRASSRIDIEASDTVTVSVTPFARWTDMDFLLHFLPSQALEENEHWSFGSQNALYIEPNEKLSLIAGVDWEYTEGSLTEFQSIPTVFSFVQGLHYDYDVEAISVSGFGSASYALTDQLTLTGAVRVDYTRYDYQNNTDADIVGRFLRPESRVDEFTTVSPKASLLYDFNDSTVYVSFARGARPPQTTDLYRLQINQTEDAADPETIDAIELGWRGSLGERIRFETAAYYMTKQNFFFRDADGFNVDDGRTRHLGAEMALDVDLTPSLSIDANVSYGAHTYRFDRAISSTANATEAIRRGDDIDTAPRWLAGARALWAPSDMPVEAELEWVFVDDYFIDASNSNTYPGHSLFHLRGSLQATKRIEIYGTIRNLFDNFYAERADFAFGSFRYFPGEERTLSVGLRFSQ